MPTPVRIPYLNRSRVPQMRGVAAQWSLTMLCVTASVCCSGVAPCGAMESRRITLHRSSSVVFATTAEGRPVLMELDEFLRSTTPIDRQLRLQSSRPVDLDTFRQFVANQVVDWTLDEQRRLTAIVELIRPKLDFLPATDLWPDSILLIKTTGREEGNAAHCRGNAIVLPSGSLPENDDALESLMLHELFHVLSRQSIDRQRRMYATIGFQLGPPIQLPTRLAHRKLTNPDAAQLNSVIHLERPDGSQFVALPVLLTKQDAYESAENRTLFGELLFRLLVVREQDGQWSASSADQPVLLEADDVPQYRTKIGRNTGYIIHPEEILADNFVHLVLQTPDLPDPRIVDQLRTALQTPDDGDPGR